MERSESSERFFMGKMNEPSSGGAMDVPPRWRGAGQFLSFRPARVLRMTRGCCRWWRRHAENGSTTQSTVAVPKHLAAWYQRPARFFGLVPVLSSCSCSQNDAGQASLSLRDPLASLGMRAGKMTQPSRGIWRAACFPPVKSLQTARKWCIIEAEIKSRG